MRRSNRNKKAQAKYMPKPLLKTYKNHLGPNVMFKRQSDYIKDAKKYYPKLMGIHNQGNNPFCALFSITTAVEVARKIPWDKQEKAARKAFCMDHGLQSGDALERTLKYYNKAFPNDMTYHPAFNMAAAGRYTGGRDDPQKTYGSANDLILGLQESVVLCCVSCADVESQYRIHNKGKCYEADWHAIACIAYIELNNEPTFVFKDTNRRNNNPSSIVFLKASELVDAELLLQQRINGRPFAGVEEYEAIRKDITKSNKFVITEMFVVIPKHPALQNKSNDSLEVALKKNLTLQEDNVNKTINHLKKKMKQEMIESNRSRVLVPLKRRASKVKPSFKKGEGVMIRRSNGTWIQTYVAIRHKNGDITVEWEDESGVYQKRIEKKSIVTDVKRVVKFKL
jgi:hypothetical protein